MIHAALCSVLAGDPELWLLSTRGRSLCVEVCNSLIQSRFHCWGAPTQRWGCWATWSFCSVILGETTIMAFVASAPFSIPASGRKGPHRAPALPALFSAPVRPPLFSHLNGREAGSHCARRVHPLVMLTLSTLQMPPAWASSLTAHLLKPFAYFYMLFF